VHLSAAFAALTVYGVHDNAAVLTSVICIYILVLEVFWMGFMNCTHQCHFACGILLSMRLALSIGVKVKVMRCNC
jgi:hypothetical protein